LALSPRDDKQESIRKKGRTNPAREARRLPATDRGGVPRPPPPRKERGPRLFGTATRPPERKAGSDHSFSRSKKKGRPKAPDCHGEGPHPGEVEL